MKNIPARAVRRSMAHCRLAALASAFMLGAAAPAIAVGLQFTNTGIGNWEDAANWNAGVPTLGSAPSVQNGGTAVINSAVSVCDVFIQSGSTVQLKSGSLASGTCDSVHMGNGTSAGTLNLSGSTNFTGNGVIQNGTLTVGTTGTVSAALFLSSDANNLISAASGVTATFSGVISDLELSTGQVQIGGAGTVVFAANNTYTGNTTINSGGTLQLGNGGTLGSVSTGAIIDNGTLALSHGSNAFTLSNIVSGTGGITILSSNTGTVSIANIDTYSGGTSVLGGTLALSGSGSIAASSGVADNGIFDISATTSGTSITSLSGSGSVALGVKPLTVSNASGTFSGVISGTGSLTLSAGTEILTGTDTYSGGTTITAGTLQIGNGGSTGSITGNVTDKGTLAFNRSDTALVYSGVISGTGGLSMIGSGTVTLNGVNTYTGTTTVSNGVLVIGDANNPKAQIVGPVSVSGTGTIRGHGITGTLTNTNGTVNPGGSIGTLTVASYTQGAGGTLVEEISPTAASELVSTGAASLNGTLVLTPDAGTYTVGTTYTLVNAVGGITGTFSTVNLGTGYGSNISPSLSYTANSVILTLKTSFIPFCPYASTSNQVAVCGGVTAGGATSALYGSLETLVTANSAGVAPALDALSGEVYTALRTTTVADDRLIRNSVVDHLSGTQGDGIVVWGDTFISSGNILHNTNAATVNHNDIGVIAGVDMPVDDGFRIGLAAAWTGQKLSIANRASTATGQNTHVIAYANWTENAISLKAGVDYGSGSNTVRRSIAFLSQNDTSHVGNNTTQLFGEGGYSFKGDGFMFEPYANLAWVSDTTGAFAETGGASSNLNGTNKTDAAAYSTVGVHVTIDTIDLGDDLQITPKLSLGWQSRLTALTPAQTVTFAATSQSFQVIGAPLSNNALVGQLGFDVALFGQGKLSIGYDGLLSGKETDHAVKADFSWSF